MIYQKLIDDLAKRISESFPGSIQLLQEDLKRSLRASLEATLNRLDLVTREEFDVQTAVLARTRNKLEKLERQVETLEKLRQNDEPKSD